jgi:hypothetical protein
MSALERRFLVLIFQRCVRASPARQGAAGTSRPAASDREALQTEAVLTDILNRLWTPTLALPQNNWWRELGQQYT